MPDPFDNHNPFGQGANNTIGQLSFGVASSTIDPYSLGNTNLVSRHDTVDVNLSLGSTKHLTSTHQTIPSQLSLHHVDKGMIRRSNLMVPNGPLIHNTCDSHSMQSQNPLNINIIMGNNSSININLLTNNTPYKYTKSTSCPPLSSMEPIGKSIISNATSNFNQPFSVISSSEETILECCRKIPSSCHLIESCSKYTPSSTDYLESHAIGSCIPNYGKKVSIRPDQGQPSSQSHNLQSNSNLNFFNLLTSYLPSEKNIHSRALPSLTKNPPNKRGTTFDGGNETLHENELLSQRNLLSHLRNLPTLTREARSQLCDHNSINRCLLAGLNADYEVAPPTSIIAPQRNVTQVINPNHGVDMNSQAQRHQHSVARHKSNPYTKNGPYTCPHCHIIFECGRRFAAHIHKHYKDESPADRKKRREGKIKKRDLRIAQSTFGMTVIPESLQLDDRLLVKSNVNDDKTTKTNRREHFAYLNVKEELMDNQVN